MSTGPSTPSLDDSFLTVSPADTHRRSVSFAEDTQDSPPTQEKKQAKKRKSWGQELPTPTTNLPPRKRAKTEAEKEQRRVERVIRNRNAAHASRERKRAEVDRLEDERNDIKNQRDDLARELQESRHEIQLLKDQVAHLSTLVTASNHATPRSFIDAASPTLTAQLFKHEAQDSLSLDQLPNQPSPLAQTAFPSPSTLDEPVATPSELTQHPAVSFGSRETGSSTTDSSHGSYPFDHPGPISDNDLGNLLDSGLSHDPDFHFTQTGQAFDQLSYGAPHDSDLFNLVDFEAFNDALDSPIDFSISSTTQTINMHTGFGASTTRCDGHGVAVDNR